MRECPHMEYQKYNRSIAPNQGYICRSRPHEGGGDTKKKTAPLGGGISEALDGDV